MGSYILKVLVSSAGSVAEIHGRERHGQQQDQPARW
jgi:hypothetical protein